uniref:Caveolin n=1 Tax=Gadus morhua TaxID=8049 RepID=A0A8C5D2F1_GADMO
MPPLITEITRIVFKPCVARRVSPAFSCAPHQCIISGSPTCVIVHVGFDDVIAEPRSTQSFDRVWIGSHAVFELAKYVFYRLLSTLLAIPMAFLLGLVFGVISCIHIWVAMPLIQSFLMLLPSARVVWRSLVDMFVSPLCNSMGKSLSSVHVETTYN